LFSPLNSNESICATKCIGPKHCGQRFTASSLPSTASGVPPNFVRRPRLSGHFGCGPARSAGIAYAVLSQDVGALAHVLSSRPTFGGRAGTEPLLES
jgi:hypothetical protein